MILYLETNFILGAAFDQEKKADALLQVPSTDLQIVLPSVCIMEAWSNFESRRKGRGTLKRTLDEQVTSLKSYPTSLPAKALTKHLQQALTENAALLNDVEKRLRDVLSKLSGLQPGFAAASLLPLTLETFQKSLPAGPTKDPTDNLILAMILAHANEHPADEKVFLSENFTDFRTPEIDALFSAAGIVKYFTKAEDFLGWFHARNKASPTSR